jgi:hypothetical protein
MGGRCHEGQRAGAIMLFIKKQILMNGKIEKVGKVQWLKNGA